MKLCSTMKSVINLHNVHVKELQRFQPAITCSELTIGTLEQCKSF